MSAAIRGIGNVIDYTPSIDIPIGQIVKEGNLLGVAVRPIVANEKGALTTSALISVSRESGATFTLGDIVYFNLATQEATDDDSEEPLGFYTADHEIDPDDFIIVLMPDRSLAISAGGGSGAWGGITGTITDQTDLVDYIDDELLPIADKTFTQPSASTIWVLDHGRSIKPNLAYWNAAGEREYPLEVPTGATELTITFATSEIHTATLPGNGTSASLRNDSILELLASEVNAASGVIDIVNEKTIIIDMDEDITFDITFTGTHNPYLPLVLAFIQGATPYTASLDTAKFKSTTGTPIPSPLLQATPNVENVFQFILGSISNKMALLSYNYGI